MKEKVTIMSKFDLVRKAVQVASKLLDIPEPKIDLFYKTELLDTEITGVFKKENYSLFLNNKWVSVSSDIEIIITTFHEVRHAYQYYCIVNEINHTRQVLEEWKDNFDNYISPTLNEDSDEKYLTQPIEKDAILWTHNIVLELFEIKTVIPKVLKALK